MPPSMSRVTFQLERPSSQVVGSSPPSPVRPTPISSMRASTIRNRRSRVESISMNGSTPTQTPAVVTPTAVSGSTAEVSKYSRSHIFFEPEFPELGPQHNQVKDAFKGISVKPPRKQKGIPPTIVETQMQPAKKDLAEVWRSHGKVFRANLVVHDEAKGGNIFTLSNNCSIDRYYKVAGRVLATFLSTSIAEPSELQESYLVGNRLVKFLSVVLPTHDEYLCPDASLAAMRQKSQAHLIELLQYMEELALLIDEMQYNKYILQDLVPPVVSSEESGGSSSDGEWKDFNNSHSTSATESASDTSSNSVSSGTPSDSDLLNMTADETVTATMPKYSQYLAQAPPPPPPPSRRQSPKIVTVEWNATFTDDVPLSPIFQQQPPSPLSSNSNNSNNNNKRILKAKPPRTTPLKGRGATYQSQSFVGDSQDRSPAWGDQIDSSPSKEEEPASMKIEERWALALQKQRDLQIEQNQQHAKYRDPDDDTTNDEMEMALMEGGVSHNKRLLQQFKGCVKCFLD